MKGINSRVLITPTKTSQETNGITLKVSHPFFFIRNLNTHVNYTPCITYARQMVVEGKQERDGGKYKTADKSYNDVLFHRRNWIITHDVHN